MAAKIGGPDLTFDDSAAPSPFPDRYTSQAISQPQTMAQPIMRVVQWYYLLNGDPDLNTVIQIFTVKQHASEAPSRTPVPDRTATGGHATARAPSRIQLLSSLVLWWCTLPSSVI